MILLTPQEAADLLKVPPATLAQWRWLRQGPPYIKLGHLVRYAQEQIERWLEANSSR
jgi:excisionase family DNA binding protein